MRSILIVSGMFAMLALIGFPTHAAPVLVARYTLDDTGTTISDSSDYGDAADGTRTNSNISTGNPGVTHMEGTAAAKFGGVSGDSINLGDPAKLDFTPGTDAFSLVAWVSGTGGNVPNGTIAAKAAASNRQYQLFLEGARLKAMVGGTQTSGTTTDFAADTVYHVAMTVSPTATTLYVDGSLEISGGVGTSTNPGQDVIIGARTGGTGFVLTNAWVDDLGFWSGALTAPQVKALQSLGSHPDIAHNAGQVQALFDVYDAGAGSVRHGSLQWNYATGLDTGGAQPGEVVKTGNRYVVALDGAGTGFEANAALIAHWKFDEVAGSATAFDSVGTNHGTLKGAESYGDPVGTGYVATRIDGMFGSALRMDRSHSHHVEVGSDNVITDLSGPKTFAFWTRLVSLDGSGNNNGLLGIDNNTSDNRWYLDDSNRSGALRMGGRNITGGFTVSGVLNYDSSEWQHVVVTDDGSGTRIYIDGTLRGTRSSFDYSDLPDDSILRLGAARHGGGVGDPGYRYLHGDLDDFGVWRVALTEPQVKALHSVGREPAFNYDLGLVQQLFDHYDAGPGGGELMLDSFWRWEYTTGLNTDPGELTMDRSNVYFLSLHADGTGLMAIPEPGTFGLLICALVAMLLCRRRRR